MMNIRKMTTDDIEDVLKISVEQFGKHSWGKSLFLDDIEKENKFAYVLTKDKTLIAFLIFMLTESEAGPEYNITNLATKQEYKKMGYAQELISFVKNFSKQNQICKIWLEVRESNLPAINLYEKLGFKTDYIRKNYYSDGENACIMSFNL